MTRDRYDETLSAQQLDTLERDYRAGRVYAYPGRITMALDAGSHYGPGVDIACGTVEPAVDEWEAGKRAPSWPELCLLAELTGYPLTWFTKPTVDDPGTTAAIVCVRQGPGRGCHTVGPRSWPPPPALNAPHSHPQPITGQRSLW